jgi:3'(2'), 5'-bisphosphate nucleotidase
VTVSLTKETNVAITAAREAAQIVLGVYRRDFEVELKARREPVTQADRRANALLVDRFSSAFPNDGIVAEESLPEDEAALRTQVSKERTWFIDPLDGTKEFIARNGEFSVMIGLAVAGRPVLGVVALPESGDVAVGVVGQGAWMLSSDGSKTALQVSSQSRLAACKAIVSRSHMSQSLESVIEAIRPVELIRCGSVGVKATRIAQRFADVYVNVHQPGGAKLWDGCAPEALLVAAGGKTTDLSGSLINYATTTLELVGGYVGTNGRVHDAVIEAATSALG